MFDSIMFRKTRKPFDRVEKILADVPFIRSIRGNWDWEDEIKIGYADKTPDFLSYLIPGNIDVNISSCWVRSKNDFRDKFFELKISGWYQKTMWDVLHHLSTQKLLDLQDVSHLVTHIEGNGTIFVWRTKNKNFLQMYLEDYRTKYAASEAA